MHFQSFRIPNPRNLFILLISILPYHFSGGFSPYVSSRLCRKTLSRQAISKVRDSSHKSVLIENPAVILEQIYEDHGRSFGRYENLNENRGTASMSKEEEEITVPSITWARDDICNAKVAALTADPIFNHTIAQMFREAMTEWWKDHPATSRYTYQGNQEAHLDAMCAYNETVRHQVENILHKKIFPLVRSLFDDLRHEQQLCLYDSLFLRYDGKKLDRRQEAGLPLHRDLGLVSINVMLNDDFERGGTFFEGLLKESMTCHQDDQNPVLFPKGVGHAILHSSNQRHAGVTTTRGQRDIWVIFVTTAELRPQDIATRLKMMAEASDLEQRKVYLKLALKNCPNDGEIWHDLGMTLHSIGKRPPHLVLEYLNRAKELLPRDARIFNNIGTMLERHPQLMKKNQLSSLMAFEQCLRLYKMYSFYNCPDVQHHLETSAWNYAIVLTNRGLWQPALRVLQLIRHDSKLAAEAEKLSNVCRSKLSGMGS